MRLLLSALATASLLVCGASHANNQPYAPSYLTLDGDPQTVKIKDWNSPKQCKGCHPRQFKGWQGSMHSIAFIDPVFQGEWALGEKETNGLTRNLCAGCHTAVGTVNQKVEFDPKMGKHGGFTTEGMANAGVSCDVCHTVSENNVLHTAMLENGNASFAIANDKVKRGPLSDSKSPMHKTEYSDLHTKSEFCGNCHNVFHPGNNFPIERTYDEWKYSPYAQAEIQCQDCHMVPVDTAIRVADEMKPAKDLENHGLGGKAARGGKPRDMVHDHGFVGGNFTVAPLLGVKGGQQHADAAKKRLQNVAELEAKVATQADGVNLLTVTVHNRRAGHNLPTSLTFIRQLWLEVVITDAKGNELLRSGSLDANNELPEGTVIFQNRAVDGDGKGPQHKPWKVAGFNMQNTIPPKGSRDATYAFNLPKGVSEYQVEVKLNYRSFSQATADLLLKDKVEVPYIEMTSLSL